jgi:hypothetical protein
MSNIELEINISEISIIRVNPVNQVDPVDGDEGF